MNYKLGDIVIKKTGGNKMTIDSVDQSSNIYYCIWFDDKKLYHDSFNEQDITTIENYRKLLKIEERADKILTILSGG